MRILVLVPHANNMHASLHTDAANKLNQLR